MSSTKTANTAGAEGAAPAEASSEAGKPNEDSKKEVEVDMFKELPVNFGSTFSTGSLIELATMKFDVPAKAIFQTCWKNVTDYEYVQFY